MFRRFVVSGCLIVAATSLVGASPASASLATDWTTVSAGNLHTCAVRGKLYCWGGDGDGQVGNGAPTGNVTSPQQV